MVVHNTIGASSGAHGFLASSEMLSTDSADDLILWMDCGLIRRLSRAVDRA